MEELCQEWEHNLQCKGGSEHDPWTTKTKRDQKTNRSGLNSPPNTNQKMLSTWTPTNSQTATVKQRSDAYHFSCTWQFTHCCVSKNTFSSRDGFISPRVQSWVWICWIFSACWHINPIPQSNRTLPDLISLNIVWTWFMAWLDSQVIGNK